VKICDDLDGEKLFSLVEFLGILALNPVSTLLKRLRIVFYFLRHLQMNCFAKPGPHVKPGPHHLFFVIFQTILIECGIGK
jgi:hypothetical protein